VIIVGIPGVGKTTIISEVAKLLNQMGHTTDVVVFGTVMLEEATKMLGSITRDELRTLSIENQRYFQELAARKISQINNDGLIIVDTHLIINTVNGYYPGLPMSLLEGLKPTYLVMLTADPREIINRRKKDNTRNRDIVSTKDVENELQISLMMVVSSSVLTGSPFFIVENNDNMIDSTTSNIIKALIGEDGERK
jgi:adenylate kinase